MAELVDARDLKSLGRFDRAGSTPALGTRFEFGPFEKRGFFYLVRNNVLLGVEPSDCAIWQAHRGESNRIAHGPEYVKGSQRPELS